ncbi:hypothetical protein ACQEVI_05950 [Promicromonospora sp. CA-289599]|uniref:hypothetical protein n=1 Tax=Promicromonospora sp. CA-289599 TaxID=3240014 RepID=UPI003D93D765
MASPAAQPVRATAVSSDAITSRVAAVAALTVAFATLGLSSAAGAGGDSELPRADERPISLTSVESVDGHRPKLTAEQLDYIIAAQESLAKVPGFGHVRYDREAHAVSFGFVGKAPENVRTTAAAAPAGLRASIERTDYTAKALQAGVDAVIAAPQYDGKITKAYTAKDGVHVVIDQDSTLRRMGAASVADAIERDVSDGVPVHVEFRSAPAQASRTAHAGPWAGGTSIYAGNSLCTTAFAALGTVGGVPAQPGILTAHHCTEPQPSGTVFHHNSIRSFGTAAIEAPLSPDGVRADASFVRTSDSGQGAIYIGDLTSNAGISTTGIVGMPAEGTPICYSGLLSSGDLDNPDTPGPGATCDHVVESNYVVWSPSGVDHYYGPGFETHHASHNRSVGRSR